MPCHQFLKLVDLEGKLLLSGQEEQGYHRDYKKFLPIAHDFLLEAFNRFIVDGAGPTVLVRELVPLQLPDVHLE